MGRPKELTEEQRADLLARGFRPVEVWFLDRNSGAYKHEVAREMDRVVEADRNDPDIDDWIIAVRGNLWDQDET